METRRDRRNKRRRGRRVAVVLASIGALGLTVGLANPASANRQYHSEGSSCTPGAGISNAYYDTPAGYQTHYQSPLYPYGYNDC